MMATEKNIYCAAPVLSALTMRLCFDRVVCALISGAFALFSAKQNGHVSKLVSTRVIRAGRSSTLHLPLTDPIGCTVERSYHCLDDAYLLRKLHLHEWSHKTVLTYKSRDHVTVSDELVWPCCQARREYTLKRKTTAPGLLRRDKAWKIDSDSSVLNMAIKRGILAALRHADTKVFWDFVHTAGHGDDNEDGAGNSNSNCGADDAHSDLDTFMQTVMPTLDF
jgi:hypothetical protein